MRILNRPMFKYGGPIKEGLMHGMKNGGSMRENQGKYLVGDPIYPKTDGRAHHAIFGGAGIAAALAAAARYGKPLFQAGKRLFGTTTPIRHTPIKQVPVLRGELYKTPFKQGKKFVRAGDEVTTNTFNPNWLGRDPLVQSLGWAGKTLTSPTAQGIGAKALRFGTAPSTLIGGLWFANGRWFNKKGEELDPNAAEVRKAIGKTGGPPGGGSGMRGTGEWFEAEAQKKLAADAKVARKAKLEKYLDTMGYDKAKKTAMGDALIDASAIVQDATTEAGSLKKADWGKMINKAIQSTSKRLDKPEQIREAVGLMLTKSEIEKDLEDPQVKKLRALEIQKGEKALAGLTTGEIIQSRMLKDKYPTGSELARLVSINNPGANIKVIPSSDIKVGVDTIDYITAVVKKSHEEGNNPMPEGNYVIKDQIIKIDADGTVTPIPINSLK